MLWIRSSIFFAGLLGGMLVSPWIPAVAILLLSLPWRAYEALLLGVVIDFLWMAPGHIPYFTIGAIFIVWVLEPLRNELLAH